MDYLNKTLGLLLILCLLSCHMRGIRVYPRGAYDKGIENIQKYSREIFPDTLMFFFPSKKDGTNGFAIQNIKECMFASFPLVKKTELNALPWQYGELYHIDDSTKYQRIIDSLLSYSIKIQKEEDEVLTFKQFRLLENIYDQWPTDEQGFPIYVSEIDSSIIEGTTAFFAYRRERQLKDTDFRMKYCKECPQQSEHGYSCGITFSNIKQEIYYWILAW